jgi:hypothetical protein
VEKPLTLIQLAVQTEKRISSLGSDPFFLFVSGSNTTRMDTLVSRVHGRTGAAYLRVFDFSSDSRIHPKSHKPKTDGKLNIVIFNLPMPALDP